MITPFIGLKDIADKIAKVTPAAVSNWRTRKDFPAPYAEISGVPIFLLHSVINWLKDNGHECHLDDLYDFGSIDKSFAVIGRPRIGKSTFVLSFSLHNAVLEKHFCGPGAAKTSVTIKLIVRRFCDESNCKIRYISRDSSLNGIEAPLVDEKIAEFLDSIKHKNKYSKTSGKEGEEKTLNHETDTIEITTMASLQALSIMDDDDNGLIVFDTPGVGSRYKNVYNVFTNTFVYMVRDDDTEDFNNTFNNLKTIMGTAQVIFVYALRSTIDNDEDYVELKNEAKTAINDYAQTLQSLTENKNIIDDIIEMLHPTETVIPMGVYSKKDINFTEKKFKEEITTTLRRVLSKDTPFQEENILSGELSLLHEHKEDIANYCKNLIFRIIERLEGVTDANINNRSYNRERFIGEKHDRVKFNDNYDTLYHMGIGRKELIDQLYKAFAAEDIDTNLSTVLSPALQQMLIKYCYRRINEAVKFDCGISQGTHNLEDNPPVTMWVLEGIISDKLCEQDITLSAAIPLRSATTYVNIMRNYYTSKSWGYVEIRKKYPGKYEYCNHKIEVFNKAELFSRPTHSKNEFINNCYCKGLMYLGAYGFYDFIIKTLGLNDNPIDWL